MGISHRFMVGAAVAAAMVGCGGNDDGKDRIATATPPVSIAPTPTPKPAPVVTCYLWWPDPKTGAHTTAPVPLFATAEKAVRFQVALELGEPNDATAQILRTTPADSEAQMQERDGMATKVVMMGATFWVAMGHCHPTRAK